MQPILATRVAYIKLLTIYATRAKMILRPDGRILMFEKLESDVMSEASSTMMSKLLDIAVTHCIAEFRSKIVSFHIVALGVRRNRA